MTTGRINQVAPFKGFRTPPSSRPTAPNNPHTKLSRAGADLTNEVRFETRTSPAFRPCSVPSRSPRPRRSPPGRHPRIGNCAIQLKAVRPLPADASFVRAGRSGGSRLRKVRFHIAPPVLAPTHSYACATRINTSLPALFQFRPEPTRNCAPTQNAGAFFGASVL